MVNDMCGYEGGEARAVREKKRETTTPRTVARRRSFTLSRGRFQPAKAK